MATKKNVTQNEDGSFTVVLMKPIEHAKKTIMEINLRGIATVADIEEMDRAKGEVEKTLHLISELSGVSLNALRKMNSADYAVVSETVATILGNES